MPNSAVNITNISKSGNYIVYSNSRTNLINAMTTTSNWSSLLVGTLNGTEIDYRSEATTNTNIKAMGSPTLELYVNSWNAKYPSNRIYIAQTASEMSDGYYGYYVSKKNNPPKTSEYWVDMSSTIGYSDILYYPYTSLCDSTYGYWLTSSTALSDTNVMRISYDGYVGYDNYGGLYDAFRPVVCLPSNIF